MLRRVLAVAYLAVCCRADNLNWLFAPEGTEKFEAELAAVSAYATRQKLRELAAQSKEVEPLDLENTTVDPFDILRLCNNDRICLQGQYCDNHYKMCRTQMAFGEPCRRDAMCQRGNACMFGHCQERVRKFQKGARCQSDDDCGRGMCCARRHGQLVCQNSLQEGQKCYVPEGGLDYAINERCPCDEGLTCKHAVGRPSDTLSPPPSAAEIEEEEGHFWRSWEGMRCLGGSLASRNPLLAGLIR